jgi:hypothetical protein
VFDPMTANMLTWYIAEEGDSGKRLRAAYASVRAKANGGRVRATRSNGHEVDARGPDEKGAEASADAEAIMACMTAGFARLEKSLEKLARAVK